MKKLVLLINLFLWLSAHAQEVPVNNGSYNLSLCTTGCPPSPGQWDGAWFDAPANKPIVAPEFNQHPTTHEWWTSFIWDPGLNTTHSYANWSYPHAVRADSFGLQVYKNRLDAVNNNFPQSFAHQTWPNQSIHVGLTGMTSDTTWVVNYGDWHVKARWQDRANASIKLDATVVPGSPFIFFEKEGNNDFEVYLRWDPIIDNTIGTNIVGFTVQGSNYGVFAPEGSTWTQTNYDGNWAGEGLHRLNFNTQGNNYFVVAPLPDTSLATLQKFAQHAYVFITDTRMDYTFDEANSTLTTTFSHTTEVKQGTETNPLIGMLPHHWKNSSTPTLNFSYETPRGELRIVEGNTFQTQMDNFGLLPQLPLTGNFPQLYQYIEDQMADTNVVESGDNYIGGKQITKLANMVELADYVGHTQAREQFLAELKLELEDWLTSPDGEDDGAYFYYNELWHTMTPYYGILGPQLLNDHHFSIGYILRGAATIAKFDQDWAREENWGAMVNMMIRHVDSWDRNDALFPYMRFHSPYFGLSNAGGSSARPGGSGQESSSEAINFAAAVYLWGLNTHNTVVRDLGMYLYLTEVETAQQYWWDVDETNFPDEFTGQHIWNVDGASSGKWTWFGVRPEYGVGINVSLMDAHLLYLGHDTAQAKRTYQQFVQDVRDHENDQSLNEEVVWEDAIWVWRALFETETIIQKYEALGDYPYRQNPWGHIEWDDPAIGTFNDVTPAHFYHWVHALDSLGKVNPNILADHSSFGVFDKNTCRHYVMYNPPNAGTKTVNFSDGYAFYLPEDTTITYRRCECTDPVLVELNFNDTVHVCDTVLPLVLSHLVEEPITGFTYQYYFKDSLDITYSLEFTGQDTIEVGPLGQYFAVVFDPIDSLTCHAISDTVMFESDEKNIDVDFFLDTVLCLDSMNKSISALNYEIQSWEIIKGNVLVDTLGDNLEVRAIDDTTSIVFNLSNGQCAQGFDTLNLFNFQVDKPEFSDTSICQNEAFNFTYWKDTFLVKYIDPAIMPTSPDAGGEITTENTGEYLVVIQDFNDYCKSVEDSINITIHGLPEPNIVHPIKVCLGDTIVFENTSNGSGGVNTWTFQNQIVSTDSVYVYFVPQDTNGLVNLEERSVFGCIDSAQSNVLIESPLDPVDAGSDTALCAIEFPVILPWNTSLNWVVLDSNSTIDSSLNQLQIGGFGVIPLVVYANSEVCPSYSDTMNIQVDSMPSLIVGHDLKVQQNEELELKVSSSSENVVWYNDSEQIAEGPSFLYLNEKMAPHYLTISAQNGVCITYDTLKIDVDREIKIPNVFTPNGDGIYDTWKIYGIESFQEANVKIYNRWGTLLYEDEFPINEWDGRYKGKLLPVATYYYVVRGIDGETFSGTITLVR